MAGLMNTLGEPLYRKQEPTGYTNAGGLGEFGVAAGPNEFRHAWRRARSPGEVDPAQFHVDTEQIERNILLTTRRRLAGRNQAGIDQGGGIGKAQPPEGCWQV